MKTDLTNKMTLFTIKSKRGKKSYGIIIPILVAHLDFCAQTQLFHFIKYDIEYNKQKRCKTC